MSPRNALPSGLLLLCLLVTGSAAAAEIPHSLQIWNNAARQSLPPWLMAWLFFLALTFLASLLFVRRHSGARWVAGGFLLSHLLVMAAEFDPSTVVRTGLVSLTHVIGWVPGGIGLLRDRPGSVDTRYALWRRVMLGVIGIALVFDLRDAGMFIYYQLADHPALGS